jgi:hypothetical protein
MGECNQLRAQGAEHRERVAQKLEELWYTMKIVNNFQQDIKQNDPICAITLTIFYDLFNLVVFA